MNIVDQLNSYGTPGWFVMLASLLFILKQVGLLDGLIAAMNSFFSSSAKLREKELDVKLGIEEKQAAITAASQLQNPMNSAWLMEQIANNSSEGLSQLGTIIEFMTKEVSHKLDIVVEFAVRYTEIANTIRNIQAEIKEGQASTQTEFDLIQRQLNQLADDLQSLIAKDNGR